MFNIFCRIGGGVKLYVGFINDKRDINILWCINIFFVIFVFNGIVVLLFMLFDYIIYYVCDCN